MDGPLRTTFALLGRAARYTGPDGTLVPDLRVMLPRRLPEQIDAGTVQIDALVSDFPAGTPPQAGGRFSVDGVGVLVVQGQPKRGDPALMKWIILAVPA